MKKLVKQPRLILASKSPRRQYLLEQAGLEFLVVPSEFDESSVIPSSPETCAKRLAECKAQEISRKYPDSWVIGADTIVFINNNILGKPTSGEEARMMLEILNDKTHQVVTGYCICHHNKACSFSEAVKTEVRFKKLTQKEIEWYTESEEPFDKAGGYAIQGRGMFLVKRINGSYTNVVGLPVCEVLDFLIRQGVVDLSYNERTLI
jgi:septum formation protein